MIWICHHLRVRRLIISTRVSTEATCVRQAITSGARRRWTSVSLMTNMCPQTHALNAGVWNSIEQQCRTWAKKYGKVYIVCEPIFLNKQHRKLGKNKVVVPDAFFKVILRTGKNPQAIGFICRNQSAKGLQKKDFVELYR